MDSLTERLAEALRDASGYVSSAASWQKSHDTFGCSDTEIQAKNIKTLLAEFDAAKAAQEKPVACAQDRASIASDAADEIERLRAERADYRCRWADAESKLAFCDGDLQTVQAERDALKARIDDAYVARIFNHEGGPLGTVELDLELDAFLPEEVIGQRVALILVDDGEGDKA